MEWTIKEAMEDDWRKYKNDVKVWAWGKYPFPPKKKTVDKLHKKKIHRKQPPLLKKNPLMECHVNIFS